MSLSSVTSESRSRLSRIKARIFGATRPVIVVSVIDKFTFQNHR
jgi:hypothetical protein